MRASALGTCLRHTESESEAAFAPIPARPPSRMRPPLPPHPFPHRASRSRTRSHTRVRVETKSSSRSPYSPAAVSAVGAPADHVRANRVPRQRRLKRRCGRGASVAASAARWSRGHRPRSCAPDQSTINVRSHASHDAEVSGREPRWARRVRKLRSWFWHRPFGGLLLTATLLASSLDHLLARRL